MKMKKIITVLFISVISMVLFSGIAGAHVVVLPKESSQGAYEKFTVRVPSEKEGTFTTGVEIKVPEEVTISRVEPKSGWSYMFTKDESEKIISVSWEITGDGLSQTEFAEFNMQGKVSEQATSLVWKAYQSYADESLVEWVGAEGADKPASITLVKEMSGVSHGHGEVADVVEPTTNQLPLYMSIAALAVALLSLLISFRRKGQQK